MALAACLGVAPLAAEAATIASLQVTSPAPGFAVTALPFAGSGLDTVVGPLDLAAADGCSAANFAGFAVGNVALIARGGCTFGVKAFNAFAAGAIGVVIYNNLIGDGAAFVGAVSPTSIPVVGISNADGVVFVSEINDGTEYTVRLSVQEVQAVPEPLSAALLATGLLGLAAARRRPAPAAA